MTKSNTVAKAAAIVAGAGLVLSSFALAFPASAQTTTTTTTTSTSAVTFSRDLKIGSTGADVTALQAWLIAKGFSIPAGATGYFGMQTKAAVAAYQAANGITPAAGYFGPITRAKVNAGGSVSTGTGSTVPGCMAGASFSSTTGAPCGSGSTGGSTGTLSGGEASLRSFDLVAGDDLREGDTNKEIAVAKFDVKGGDARIERVTVDMQPKLVSSAARLSPWSYIDTLSVYSGSKKIGSISAGSKSDWNKNTADSAHTATSSDYYSIDVPVDTILKEGNNQELSIRADAQGTIDTNDQDQIFYTSVPNNGIRAVDSQGIQQYTGKDNDTVQVGFNGSLNGDLTVRESSSDPAAGVLVADANKTTGPFDALAFEIKNKDAASVDFNTLTFTVATSSPSGSPAANITNIIRRATLDLDGDTYTGTIKSNNTIVFDNLNTSVADNSTVSGTVSVEFFTQTGHYAASGESIKLALAASGVDAEGTDSANASTVSGTAQGNQQTIAISGGINVAGKTNTAVLTYNSQTAASSYGTFTINFDVTAAGDNVYVPKSIQALASTTSPSAGTGVVVITDLIGSTTSATVNSALTSSADSVANNLYLVRDGDTETFTATVTIDPTASGFYEVGLDRIRFTTDSGGGSLQTLDVDQTKTEFQAGPLNIPNS